MAELPQSFIDGLKESDFKKAPVFGHLVSGVDLVPAPDRNTDKRLESWDVAFSPDGCYIAWSCGRRLVKVIPTHLINEVREINEYMSVRTMDCRQIVTSVAFASCADAAARYTSKSLDSLSVGYRSFHWETFDLILAVGLRNGRIRIFDVIEGNILLELIDHTDCVTKLTFAPDNSLLMLSSSADGTIKCWDLTDDGNMTHTFKPGSCLNQGHLKHKVNHTAWSPDAKRMAAVGFFKTVMVFDMDSYKCVKKLTGHICTVTCCDFSPDGVLLATSSADTKTIIWNSYTGDKVCTLGHQYPEPSPWFPQDTDTVIHSVRFSRSGLHVVTVSSDDYIRFWDLTEDHAPSHISKVPNPLCCCFSKAGNQLAVGIASGSVYIIEANCGGYVPLAHQCRLVTNRALSKNISRVKELQIPSELKDYLTYNPVQL